MNYWEGNAEMEMAWQFVADTGVSVFLTGKAGTGKTTFLKRLRQLTPKRMVVLAPTGVAAINAEGQTIHSFFQLPLGPIVPGQKTKPDFRMSESKKNLIRTLDLLVIDEISMVRADVLDAVDNTLRQYRDRLKPFGGVQLLLIGDLMQLTPVAKNDEWALLSPYYQTPYFFSSRALQSLQYVTIELSHIYRQQDEYFINLLSQVRNGQFNQETFDAINKRYIPGFNSEEEGWIRLTTHNAQADSYNNMRLERLQGEMHEFDAQVSGDFPELSYPADSKLQLKVGAQVMFLKNDPSLLHAYFNGKIGTVTAFGENTIEVTCDNGDEVIDVERVDWNNTRYALNDETKEIEEKVIGVFRQFPLRLAWAITVHKSQGLTFDHAVLDINASFAHGQAYVALSRCRSLEGMVLSTPIDGRSIILDRSVNNYMSQQAAYAKDAAQRLPELKYQYTLSLLDELYTFHNIYQDFQRLLRVVDENLRHQHPDFLQLLKSSEAPLRDQITEVAARFRHQYATVLAATQGNIADSPIGARIQGSAVYFVDKLNEIFAPIINAAAINIENKQTQQIYKNALQALRDSLAMKLTLFEAFKTEDFSTHLYFNLKAKALLKGLQLNKTNKDKRPTTFRTPKAPKSSAVAEPAPKEKKPKVNTLEETYKLYEQGLTPEQIAEQRTLTTATIYNHLAKLVEADRIEPGKLISPDKIKLIGDVVKGFDSGYSLSEVKEKLPEEITFGEIRLAIAALKL